MACNGHGGGAQRRTRSDKWSCVALEARHNSFSAAHFGLVSKQKKCRMGWMLLPPTTQGKFAPSPKWPHHRNIKVRLYFFIDYSIHWSNHVANSLSHSAEGLNASRLQPSCMSGDGANYLPPTLSVQICANSFSPLHLAAFAAMHVALALWKRRSRIWGKSWSR